MAQLHQLPGGSEVWRAGNAWYVVYKDPVHGTNMAWKFPKWDDVEAAFGPGRTPEPDRVVSGSWQRDNNVLVMGNTTMINNTSEHPFETFARDFEREAKVRPYLQDPEIVTLMAGAIIEGRTITEAELKTTDWWRNHNERQRQWLTLNASDPATADQMLRDHRRAVHDLMRQSGITNAPWDLVKLLADNWTSGNWSEAYLQNQVVRLADPWLAENQGNFHPDIQQWLANEGRQLTTTRQHEDTVRQTVERWLGPQFADWSEGQIKHWAGRLRNDPNAEIELTEMLQQQRLALFPNHENPNLTYEDIAAPWKQFFSQVWGRVADDNEPLLHTLINLNDAEQARQVLRKEGLERGVGQVVDGALSDLFQSVGGDVRSPV